MDREAWWAIVLGVAKESNITQQLNNKFDYIFPVVWYVTGSTRELKV